MASREKKPLAPSKPKQKASSDSGLPSNEVKNKKGKSLPSIKQQQLAREIFDTVATGNQLLAKLEANLPRKKALKNLKRKQNLRVAKANLIKSKVTKKVTNKNIRGISSDIKKGVKAKKVKPCEESTVKSIGITLRLSENQTNSGDNEGKGTETPSKSAKNNLRTKKTKSTSLRSVGEAGNEDIQDTEEASVTSSTKSSPKLGKKKAIESADSLSKSAKTAKSTNLKKNSVKDVVAKVTEGDNKSAKGKKSTGKELDCGSSVKSNTSVEKVSKVILDNKSSIDRTIDAVIASMLSDPETDSQQSVTEKIEGKVTRSRKMLVDENTAADIEVKKEPDTEDTKVTSDGEYTEADQGQHMQNAIQLRKRSKLPVRVTNHPIDQVFQSSLRNGKQRHLSDSGNSASDADPRRHRLNSDGPPVSDNSIEHIPECNVNTDSCLSEPSCNESQTTVASTKEDVSAMKDEASKNFDEDAETGSEIEHNNNSDRIDRTGEIGPILRSKTKTKSTETEATKDDNIKTDDTWVSSKCVDAQDDSKKLNNLDQARKDSILAKLGDKPKGRRNSLNIDMKKTVNSFYNADKSDTTPKAPIDKIIEGIKLTIVKSIEDKIYRPGLSKSFDMPKSEEVIAPLSTESQKLGLEENTDEDKSIVTENESTSESSENSVPKVADTAKEIEKLVMFDIEEAETHSQNTQENKASGSDRINDVHNTCESTCNISNNNGTSRSNAVDESEAGSCSNSTNDTSASLSDNDSKLSDENKKAVITRKSPRISDKGSDSTGSPETRKSNRTPNKVASKSDDADAQKSSNEDTASACDSPKEDTVSSSVAASSTPPEQAEEKLSEVGQIAEKKSAEESETEISLNFSGGSDDSETLESISREVEKLVAGDQIAAESSSSPVNDATQSEDVTFDTKVMADKEHEIPDASDKHEASARCDDDSEESTVAVATNEASKSCADEKSVSATETLQEDDRSPCETTQDDVKHHKTSNNHSSTTTNCDSSNSECSSVNPVPTHTCTSDRQSDETEENVKPDQDSSENCKESDKSNGNSPTNCDTPKSLDENQKSGHNDAIAGPTADESSKSSDDKASSDEQKPINEENRRVLRARDKQKKIESRQASRSREHVDNNAKLKTEAQNADKMDTDEAQDSTVDEASLVPEASSQKTEDTSDSQNNSEDVDPLESQGRTRRSRDGKRRREEPPPLTTGLKTKRTKRDLRKSDQQNKEETLLDNEVAKINENNGSFLDKFGGVGSERASDSLRGFFEKGAQTGLDKLEKSSSLRSKSENDLTIAVDEASKSEERLLRNLSENHVSKRDDDVDLLADARKTLKTPETSVQKDSDEASTSGESSNSGTPKILETPEDKAKKESILGLFGLVSLEKAAERLNHQRARKEQYTGTLKTIIRVQKEKDKDKKGSRSPLKMVLKQQGRGDGEGDSPEFYTIQKEFGTSGLGDSSSDEDNEETTPKDRQSLVIPEKSSSFSIHPERLCADVCCYCFGKFGSLDTPMHLAQMKSDERRQKILHIERHLTKDSCLCDACYRHVDRKANTTPTNMQQKPPKQHRQLMVLKCSARECRDPARHNVKRRWLLKIKPGLQNQVDIDWESSQHTSMSFCVNHYGKIERFLTCALCKRRLVRNHTHQLSSAEIVQLNQLIAQHGIPVILAAGTFVCKLCRYFTQLQLKYKDVDNMNMSSRGFFKSYRKRILHYHDVEVPEFDDDDAAQSQAKDKRKKSAKGAQSKNGGSKSPDRTTNSMSEKLTPELSKSEGGANEMDTEGRTAKSTGGAGDEAVVTDAQYLAIERAVENLKKRKLLDPHASYTTMESPVSSCGDVSHDVEEILAMDKEVTLTRLPKRARSNNNNDIAPVVQRLGANPSISVRTLFPGEEEMNLHGKIEFGNVREITPQGWEKCATMIQYDRDTKMLWQELQRPYGNQSSFLRHLILLEKYYRSGDLILAPNASRNAINYSTSVQNRLISYEGPEKMDEPIMDPIGVPSEYTNSRRLSGGYMLEKDNRLPSLPSTSSSMKPSTASSSSSHSTAKANSSPPRMLKLNTGVSIIKKPPPNLQRFSSLPSTSTANGGVKRKDAPRSSSAAFGGRVFQYNEADIKRLQTIKRQKQFNERTSGGPSGSMVGVASSPPGLKAVAQYQKTQLVQHNQQFQQHLRMQQEMLNRQSRGDFEPLICDMRTSGAANENSSTHNLIQNLNLPKSIQVTTKPSNPIPILPKIPKSLTVIPQTVTRPVDK